MNLEGKKVTVKKSAKELYEFLLKLDNYGQLMPDDIKKFEVDGESFIFAMKGAPEIRMIIKDKVEFSKVELGAASSKLNFKLLSDISEVSENECETQIKFESDLNPMMAMMVKKPLTNFIDALTENLEKL